MPRENVAKFAIGQVVKHRRYPFRGVIYDVDPVFANTEEWWLSIPEELRPHKDQPFYHLFAENAETEYVAYVSEQNLLPDNSRQAGAPSTGRRDLRARRRRRLSHAGAQAPLSSGASDRTARCRIAKKTRSAGIDDRANRPHFGCRSNFIAGETGVRAGAEGETAPETLRPKGPRRSRNSGKRRSAQAFRPPKGVTCRF